MFANIPIIMENIYDVLTRPVFSFYRIAKQRHFQQAAIVLFINVLIGSLTQTQLIHSVITGIIMSLAGTLVQIVITVSIIHLFAILAGGKGDIRGLLCSVPYALFPTNLILLGIPLQWIHLSELLSVWTTVTTLWSIALYVIAISQNYQLSTLRSLAVLCLPFILLFLLIFIIIISGFFLFAAGLAQHPDIFQKINDLPGINF